MKRRNFLHGAALAATLSGATRTTLAQKTAAKTLRIIHNGNLASLDPDLDHRAADQGLRAS